MSPPRKGWNEANLSEDPAIRQLVGFGYSFIAAATLELERESPKEVVLTKRLAKPLKKPNPWLSPGPGVWDSFEFIPNSSDDRAQKQGVNSGGAGNRPRLYGGFGQYRRGDDPAMGGDCSLQSLNRVEARGIEPRSENGLLAHLRT
jgi:hypothetical protein